MSVVLYEKKDRIAYITLNRPDKLNSINDEMVEVGGRVYVKATAKLTGAGNSMSDCVEVSAYARESETKKGMDDSQITGSASSYARKYALNGLFCIDDTKDADTMDNSKHETKPVKEDAVNLILTAIEQCKDHDELAVVEQRFNDKTKPYFTKKNQEQHNETILQALDSKSKELG